MSDLGLAIADDFLMLGVVAEQIRILAEELLATRQAGHGEDSAG